MKSSSPRLPRARRPAARWVALAGALALAPAAARAQPPGAPPAPGEGAPSAPSAPGDGAPAAPPPTSAAMALDRATAAYEYGDLTQMIESARLVTEGAFAASDDQRAEALRLLGIGLFLSRRPDGAESAFTRLLELRPKARLDPTTTRPEIVAFFRDVRRRQTKPHHFVLNLLPPLGQIQNRDFGRAWLFGSVEAVSLGAYAASYFVLKSWQQPGSLFPGHEEEAKVLKTVHLVSLGVFAATYVLGVVDAVVRSPREDDEGAAPPRLTVIPVPLALPSPSGSPLPPLGAALMARF